MYNVVHYSAVHSIAVPYIEVQCSVVQILQFFTQEECNIVRLISLKEMMYKSLQ